MLVVYIERHEAAAQAGICGAESHENQPEDKARQSGGYAKSKTSDDANSAGPPCQGKVSVRFIFGPEFNGHRTTYEDLREPREQDETMDNLADSVDGLDITSLGEFDTVPRRYELGHERQHRVGNSYRAEQGYDEK